MSEVKLQPRRVIPKGARVRNIEQNDRYILFGATGVTVETDTVPWVVWDSYDMLTEEGKCDDQKWAQSSKYLEEITTEPDALDWRDLTQDEMRVVIVEVLAHGTNNGLDAFNNKIREILAKLKKFFSTQSSPDYINTPP